MDVQHVGSHRHVHGHREAVAPSGDHQARVLVGQLGPLHRFGDRLTEPGLALVSAADRGVQELAGFRGDAEAASGQRRIHVLAGPARERDLVVVDDAGAVERQRGDHPSLHQIDQQRAQAHLDDVRTHRQDHRASRRARRDDAIRDLEQVSCSQKAREPRQEIGDARARNVRPPEVLDADLAGSVRQRHGAHHEARRQESRWDRAFTGRRRRRAPPAASRRARRSRGPRRCGFPGCGP